MVPTSPTRRVSFPRIATKDDHCDEEEDDDDDDEARFERYDSQVFTYCGDQPCQEAVNNPLKPRTLIAKLTADRKRWTHTFPRGWIIVYYLSLLSFMARCLLVDCFCLLQDSYKTCVLST